MTAATALDLQETVTALLHHGKGILAADESLPTITTRFASIGVASTEESRRAYRELLFTTPGLSDSISGAILFEETLGQQTAAGTPMPEALAAQSMVPGIKVDTGTTPLAAFAGERLTTGLDGLRDRLVDYRERGARFTKWRAVLALADNRLSRHCIEVNARALAMFAALSQEAGLVPLVEPELLMDGPHTLEQCDTIVSAVLESLFTALFEHRVVLEHTLLKTGMVLPGIDCPDRASPSLIADTTLRCLRRTVPAAVPGVLFLSGGQSPEEATERLAAIVCAGSAPWVLTFSFGRALQAPALDRWKGSAANVAAAQAALRHRAEQNGAAVRGVMLSGVESVCP